MILSLNCFPVNESQRYVKINIYYLVSQALHFLCAEVFFCISYSFPDISVEYVASERAADTFFKINNLFIIVIAKYYFVA